MANILVVEDESVLRLTFGEFLKQDGHTVVTAEDYPTAVKHLDREDFDLIITDIILSGKTGVDLLRTVRERAMKCPVVMITGEPNIETASEAVRLGAFDYLAKPVTRVALGRVSRMALEQKRLTDERDHYAAQMDYYRRDLQAIFNSVTEGIVTFDADLRIRQVNPTAANLLGWVSCSQTGKTFDDVATEGLLPVRDSLKETIRSHRPQPEIRMELSEKVVMGSTAPLISEGNRYTGVLLILRDVTRLVRLEEQVEESQQYRNIIGKSARMQEIFRLIKDLAEAEATVLIIGESGTGKELVASALHHASPRAKGPFLRVNCAALSEDILESELFGHVKGAFTGAVKDRVGRFEAANGGTILLDEIGDISPRLQLRLLRVLQEREFDRVGSSTPIRTDVRVLASTNRDLEELIRRGEFRQDLYYRLNVVRIEIPALRERRQDIPLLIEHYLHRYAKSMRKDAPGVAPETLEVLMNYPWPGNVRELENCMERAVILCHDAMILPKHLPRELATYEPKAIGGKVEPEPPLGSSNGSERDRIITVLRQTDWNVAKSARLLGVARNTLYNKIRTLEIERPEGE